MASHHHSYHHHHSQNPIPVATTTVPAPCNCQYNHCCSQPQPPPPPNPLSIDPNPILQALSLLLQNQQQPNHHKHHNRKNPNHHHKSQFQLHSEEIIGKDQLTHSVVISSLLQRISSLESSIAQFHSSSSSKKRSYPSYSLREAAARVIQSHFRVFLVQRSRTLSQLQDLAFIKSSFNSLKSSISERNHFNYGIVSQKAMDLLLKLDSIQGCDPMIRDGKRSISGNIVRFLEFIDALTVKRHERLCKPVKNVRFVRNCSKSSRALNSNGHFSVPQKELVEKLSKRVEKIRGLSRAFENDEEDVELECFQEFNDDDDNDEEEEEYHRVLVDRKHSGPKIKNGVLVNNTFGKPRVKKSVSFADNEDLCRIFSDPPEPVLNGDSSLSDGSNSSDDHGEHVDYNEIEEERKTTSEDSKNDEVYQDEKAASSHSIARNLRSGYSEMISCHQDEDGRLVFSPPAPVKMESRADLMQQKRKTVKIVT